MTPAGMHFAGDADLGIRPERPGPVQAAFFERLPQNPEHPMELISGWILPLTPTGFSTGCLLSDLLVTLNPFTKSRGWCLTPNTRHRLIRPPQSIVFPSVSVHCAGDAYVPIEPDAEGYFRSEVLGSALRLVPAALRAT